MICSLAEIFKQVRNCKECESHLPLGCNPVVRGAESAKIVIIGQAPGTKVHASGVPWDDASGDRLRFWLGLDKSDFYDESKIALIPMGFCYPGRGKSGDLPPRKECAPLWHERIFSALPNLQLKILVGSYAQKYYLKNHSHYSKNATLTQTVQNWRQFQPNYFPLVHPSPRNQLWLQKNPWFEQELLEPLRAQVLDVLG
ncbi:uracil-DNA glycosylase family protein [Sessilibacter sp. MAH1]